MLPADPVGAHRIVGRLRGLSSGQQGLDHFVGVSGLLQIVDRCGEPALSDDTGGRPKREGGGGDRDRGRSRR